MKFNKDTFEINSVIQLKVLRQLSCWTSHKVIIQHFGHLVNPCGIQWLYSRWTLHKVIYAFQNLRFDRFRKLVYTGWVDSIIFVWALKKIWSIALAKGCFTSAQKRVPINSNVPIANVGGKTAKTNHLLLVRHLDICIGAQMDGISNATERSTVGVEPHLLFSLKKIFLMSF